MVTPPNTSRPLPDQPVAPGEAGPVLVALGLEGPQSMQRRLWFLLPLASLSISLVWGGVLQALLALQVAGMIPNKAAQAGVLGVVLTVGAIGSTVFTPFVGRFSDRTRTRFLGRRNIWILGGAIGGAILLIATGLAPNPVLLTIGWALALIPLNAFQGAAAAVVPERVPVAIRARLTAVNGMGALVGVAIGSVIGLLVPDHFLAFVILAVQLVVIGAIFAFVTRDVVPATLADGAKPGKSDLLNIRKHRDFWIVFAARFLAFVGYNLATGLQFYALRDHFGAADPKEAAATAVGVSTLLLIVSAITGGILADKFGRMKPFVIAASALFVPAAIILAIVPSVTGNLIGIAILGFGFGSYISVDGALVTRVLPRIEDAGRDLGILNIANAGPQVVAPALAGGIVSAAGYPPLYVLVAVVAAAASVLVGFVRSVR